jgi:hypothetical protein
MVRRHARVRKSRIVGLGKEANRIEAGRVLGQTVVGGKAKTYVDWKARLLAMGRAEAKSLDLPWSTVTRWKRRLRSGQRLANGHGGKVLDRVTVVLMFEGEADWVDTSYSKLHQPNSTHSSGSTLQDSHSTRTRAA